MNAPDAWQHLLDVGRPGGRGAVVAVLDTGVAYRTRTRFRKSTDFSRGDFVRGYDFVDDDRFPHDENGHGTHVASTIGESTHNDRGVTGLAYGAKIMPVRVLNARGEGESAVITAGIRYAVRHGADVINLSFEFDDTFRQFTASEIPDVLAAIRFASRRGVVVVGAAGNFDRGAISYPARAPTRDRGRRDDRARAAARPTPTSAARSTSWPRAAGRTTAHDATCPRNLPAGRDIYQMTFPWAGVQSAPHGSSSYRRFGLPSGFIGTSMAAPHVSATVALMISSGVLGPNPTPQAVQAAAAGHGDRRRGARLRRGVRLRPARRRRGHRSAQVVRMISTEHGAWCETLFGTEPSRNRLAPVMPLLPTTIRSAPRSSATSRMASAGSPWRA